MINFVVNLSSWTILNRHSLSWFVNVRTIVSAHEVFLAFVSSLIMFSYVKSDCFKTGGYAVPVASEAQFDCV